MDELCYFSTLKASTDSWILVIPREHLLQMFDSQHALAAHLVDAVESKHAAQIKAMMTEDSGSSGDAPLRTPYNSFMYYYNRAAGREGRERHAAPPLRKVPAGAYVYTDAAENDTAYFLVSGHLNLEASGDIEAETEIGQFYRENVVPGRCVGLMSVLLPPEKLVSHSVTLKCISASTLVPMDAELVKNLIAMFPAMGKLLKHEAERMAKTVAVHKLRKEQALLASRAAAEGDASMSMKKKKKAAGGAGGEEEHHGHLPLDLHEAMSGPPTNAVQARLTALRRLTSKRCLTAFHVIRMLASGLFPKSGHRVELAVTCFHSFKDRDHFGEVLYTMSQSEQVATARRLGYKNIFSWRRPNLHYHLRLSHPDEYEIAKMLARFAVHRVGDDAASEECFRNLVINGRPRRLPENHNFWHHVEGPLQMGEKPTNVLDFDFHTSPEEIGSAIARLVQMRWRVRVHQRLHCQKVVAALIMQAAYVTHTAAWKSATATELKRAGGRMARMTVEQYRDATLAGLYMFRGTLYMSIHSRWGCTSRIQLTHSLEC
jgi:CRP-like cAMP-binding protein